MYKELVSAWNHEVDKLYNHGWLKRIKEGNVGKDHYVSYLIETYHHAGMNPQLQAYATMYFNGRPRDLVKKFYQHAISEIGHDLLALSDAANLGFDKDKIVASRPLATTLAYNALPFYQVQQGNILGYLGYLFHLEHLPTRDGNSIIEMLIGNGIPANATSFLEEHAKVDYSHNKLMEIYVSELVKTKADLNEAIASAKDAALLHYYMMDAAFERAEEADWKLQFK